MPLPTKDSFILHTLESLPTDSFPLLKQLAIHHQVDAVALATVKARRLDRIHTAVGRATAKHPDRHTLFQAASLSKPVFAFVVFKLLDQGVLALDAPVFNYLSPTTQQNVIDVLARSDSEVASKTRPESLTVRMLLSHTGGLPNFNDGKVKFSSVPGTQWEYSGVGFQLLQKAVETTTGELLNSLAERFVFAPLEMGRSSFVFNPQPDSNVAIGTGQDGTPMEPKFMPEAYAAYSLVSTAEDYGKFLTAVLSDARMLGQITDSTTTVSEELNFRWGLGWGVEWRGDERLIWQWGNNNGYRAFVMGSAQTGDGFVMLTNSANGLPMAKPLAEYLLPGGHPIFGHEYLSS